MTVVNKFNVNNKQVTMDADIIENMSANDVSYDDSTQYDENTVGDKLNKLLELDSKICEGTTEDGESTEKELYITDKDGNVLAKYNSDGLVTTDVRLKTDNGFISVLEKIKDSRSLTDDEYESIKSLMSGVIGYYGDTLYISDANGYVIFKANADGVSFKSSEKKTWMGGKVLMSLCDSLGTAGEWQGRIAELTGMSFDRKLNYNGNNDIAFSVGGTQTATHPNGGFDRAKRLVDYVRNGGKVDVVMLENINDVTWIIDPYTKEIIDGMIATEQPFFSEQFVYVDTPATNYTEAGTYFRNNLSSCLASIEIKKGTTLYLSYSTTSEKIVINSKASSNGNLSLVVGGKTYNVSVTAGMSESDIIDKILEIDFTHYNDTKVAGENSVLFTPNTYDETASLSFNANGTGVTATITSIESKSYRAETYNSLDLSATEWEKTSNWGELWGHNLVQIMKGLLEYLCSNLIDVQFYWFIPTRFSGVIPSVKKADGTIDFDAYKRSTKNYDLCAYLQKKVCEYYSIPVIDLHNEGGINIFNQLAYYQLNGGVHPPRETYRYWGDKAVNCLI